MTVASATARADVALPATSPVAELLPELARRVGLLDGATAHDGHRLVTRSGRSLDGEAGLAEQGVGDGELLTVLPGTGLAPARRYDDVVEAMRDVVERDAGAWTPEAGRRSALVAALLLAALGAVALLTQRGAGHGAVVGSVVAAVVAAALVLAALACAHAEADPRTLPAAWLGVGYAAVAGALAGPVGPPLVGAGAAATAAGLVVLGGCRADRALLVPVVGVGAALLATGLLGGLADLDPAPVLTTLLVLAVLAGSVFPWLALEAAGTRVDLGPAGIDPGRGVDPARIARGARVAHRVLLALSAAVGLLLVVAAPPAVGLGPPGTAIAVLACLVVVLRTRQYRAGSAVLIGLAAGVLGLLATATAVLVLHPSWRLGAAGALAVAGAALLAATRLPVPSVRRARLGDLLETAALLAMPPLLVLATGLFTAVRG